MISKILLINPPYYVLKDNINFYPSFPLGMGYIAAYLEKKGYTVKAIDAFGEGYDERTAHDDKYLRIGVPDREILSRLADFSPDLVGISNLFSIQHFALHSMARIIRIHYSDMPIVAGGPHISAVPELVMTDKNIDYGVLGEGEQTLVELIGAINGGKGLKDIQGITYRDGGEVMINRLIHVISDLDEIPFPAWHLFKMDKYLNQKISHGGLLKRRPFMTILTSRGCPLNCFFCSVRDTWGRTLRVRSPENVISEIKVLREKFGIKELIIVDDNFNFNIERLRKILDFLIDANMDLALRAPNGFFIPRLDKEILLKMKKAGFYKICFPIESGSKEVLNKIIRKPVDLDRVRELVAYCKTLGIDVVGYFILGLPGETKAQMRQTFKLARELKIEPYFSIATPFPGSDLYRFVKEKGLLKSYEPDKCSDEYNISTSNWSAEELRKFIWWEEFKLDYRARLVSYLKNPSKVFKKVAELAGV